MIVTKNTKKILCIGALFFLAGCSGEEDSSSSGGFDSGIPETKEIISEAVPSGVSSAASFAFASVNAKSQDNPFAIQSTSCTLNNTSTAGDIVDCMQRHLLANPANNDVAAQLPDLNVFKHVSEFDYRVGQLEARFTEKPSCFDAAPTPISISVDAGGSNTALGGTIYLQCRESHSVPSGVDSQEMGVGFNSGKWYLFMRTSYNSAESARVLVAEANETGTDIKAWLFSYRDNNDNDALDTPSAGDPGSDDAIVARVIANRSTKDFFFGSASYNYNNNPFVETWMRSDGTNLNILGMKVSGAGSSNDRQSTFANGGCVTTSDLNASGDCTSLGTLPTDSGLGGALQETDLSDTTLTDIKALLSVDISSVGQFSESN